MVEVKEVRPLYSDYLFVDADDRYWQEIAKMTGIPWQILEPDRFYRDELNNPVI